MEINVVFVFLVLLSFPIQVKKKASIRSPSLDQWSLGRQWCSILPLVWCLIRREEKQPECWVAVLLPPWTLLLCDKWHICVCVLSHSVIPVTQSYQTLCDFMNCSLLGFSVHGISQAKILEWVAISFSRDILDPGIKATSLSSPELAGRFFTTAPPGKPQMVYYPSLS